MWQRQKWEKWRKSKKGKEQTKPEAKKVSSVQKEGMI